MGKIKTARYLPSVEDRGIILRRSRKGEPFYPIDGVCIREAMLHRVNGSYYLVYDAFGSSEIADQVRVCMAKSENLTDWIKLGPKLEPTGMTLGDTPLRYADYNCACSPWFLQEDGKWYIFYIGSCGSGVVPLTPYTSLLATADNFEGPWQKQNTQNKKNNHVLIPLKKDSYYEETACSGHVLRNPKWRGEQDTENKKYMMFFGAAAYRPELERCIGIARTNELTASGDWDDPEGNFWQVDEQPIIPASHDVENTSIYYEPANQTYFLFTNHIDETNCYTDAIWVYWTKDLDCWNPENRAVVIDAGVSSWAKGAIGMPTVLKIDAHTLALVYDGVEGMGRGHLDRDIGLAYISLPLFPPV